MNLTQQQVEQFLYNEAALLDEWKMEEWAALFSANGVYLVPPIGNPNADFNRSLYIVHDDRTRLEHRAIRLLKKEAHVEYPHSTTVHNYHNIRIVEQNEESIKVQCNFATYRTKREVMDCYIGVLEYTLVTEDENIKIQEKKVILKLDSLRPHGKVSLIL